jgi:hypothetical protein
MSGSENDSTRAARVVILSPNAVLGDAHSLGSASVDISVVTHEPVGVDARRIDGPAWISVPRPTGLSGRLISSLSTSALLMEMLRITPLDPGAVFWRVTRRNPRVLAAIASADLIVAPEREGVFAAWQWARRAARRGRNTPAVFGYPAARAQLARMSA